MAVIFKNYDILRIFIFLIVQAVLEERKRKCSNSLLIFEF